MLLWLRIQSKPAGRQIAVLGSVDARGGSGAAALLESACPRKPAEAVATWYLNQVFLRAKINSLPQAFDERSFLSLAETAQVCQRRHHEEMAPGPRASDAEATTTMTTLSFEQRVKSLQSLRGLASAFLGASPPPSGPKSDPLASNERLGSERAAAARGLLAPIEESGPGDRGPVLILPVRLRAPIEESISDTGLLGIATAVKNGCKLYAEHTSLLQALALQAKSLSRGLYVNKPKSTIVQRSYKDGVFSAEEVQFTYDHTIVEEDSAVRAALNRNRAQAAQALLSSDAKIVYVGTTERKDDLSSELFLLKTVANFLISSSKRESDPRRRALLHQYGRRWLYKIVEMEGHVTSSFSVTKRYFIPILGKLSVFISSALDAQKELLSVLRKHPHLVPHLAGALRPLAAFSPDAKGYSGEAHEDYVALFRDAAKLPCPLDAVARAQILNVGLMRRFRVHRWLSVAKPPVTHAQQLLIAVADVCFAQTAATPPPRAGRTLTREFVKQRKAGREYLHGVLKDIAAYEFPQIFRPTLALLLQNCVGKPRRMHSHAWRALISCPLAKLSWSVLVATLEDLGGHVDRIIADRRVRSPHPPSSHGDVSPRPHPPLPPDGSVRSKDRKNATSGVTPSSYMAVGEAAQYVLAFAVALVRGAIRKLHFVRAQASGGRTASPEQLRTVVSRNGKALWRAMWAAFSPWMSPRDPRAVTQGAVTLGPDHQPTAAAVARALGGCVTLLCCPHSTLPGRGASTQRIGEALWPPSQSMKQFWHYYTTHIAPSAPILVLQPLHSVLVARTGGVASDGSMDLKRSATQNQSFTAPRIPFEALTMTTELCEDAGLLLHSMWLGRSPERASLRLQAVVGFAVHVVSHSAWRQRLASDMRSRVNGLGVGSGLGRGASMVGFAVSFLKLIIHLVLVEPCPYPPAFSAMLRELINLDWQGLDSDEYEAVLLATTDMLYKRPGASFRNRFSDSSRPNPQIIQRADTGSDNAPEDTKAGPRPPNTRRPHPPRSAPQMDDGSDAKVQSPRPGIDGSPHVPTEDTMVLGEAAAATGQEDTDENQQSRVTDMQRRLKGDWLPSFRRDRAAFVLRFVLAMALPYPTAHKAEKLKSGIDKTLLYVEWLLSTFHTEGPTSVAAPAWYCQMTRRVLNHLNLNIAPLLSAVPRDPIVRVMGEVLLSAREGKRDAVSLAQSLLTQYPAVAPEVISAVCATEKDTKRAAFAVHTVIQSAWGSSAGRPLTWTAAGGAIVLTEAREKVFFESCATRGLLYPMCALCVREVVAAMPSALQFESKRPRGHPPSSAFRIAQAAVTRLATHLSAATLAAVDALADNEAMKEAERAAAAHRLELELVCAVRACLGIQMALVARAPPGGEATRVRGYANTSLASIAAFLRKSYQSGKFGSSKMARLGGKLAGMFGRRRPATDGEFSDRWRLFARGLYSFLAAREDLERASTKAPVYAWRANTLVQNKTQAKVIKHFLEQTKVFASLRSQAADLAGWLGSSSLTLVQVDAFVTKMAQVLFSDAPWPLRWHGGA